MIARVWRGWTSSENADAYEKLLREVVYPGLQKIDGYQGGYIFHRSQDAKEEIEFVTVNLGEKSSLVLLWCAHGVEGQSILQALCAVLGAEVDMLKSPPRTAVRAD